jgi:hypothetical protein
MEILFVHIPLHFILINIGIFTIGNIFYRDFLSCIVIMDISSSAIIKCSQKHRLLNFAYKNMDIKRLKPATLLCVSQARTWISNVICRGLFFLMFSELRWEVIVCFVDLEVVDHHYLNVLFIIALYLLLQSNMPYLQ